VRWQNARVETQVEEVAQNRVRLTVEVPGAHVKHAVEHAASDLAEQVKIPGFRSGKVPLQVLISRLGKERIYAEAIESHIGGWFWNAALRERLRPVTGPAYDYELPDSDADDWSFSAEVEVQEPPELPDWKTLEVGYDEPELPEDIVDHELEVLRSSVAELIPVEGRPVKEQDVLLLDLTNAADETERDLLVELGAGQLSPEVEQALLGMEAGETKTIVFERSEEGAEGSVDVTVKEIKEKELPPLDDALAKSASEFDTLAELRADVERRLREYIEARADEGFRARVVDALVEATNVQPRGPLVESRARELLNGLARSLERRGIPLEVYLQATGTTPQQLQERVVGEAMLSVAREIVLEAVANKLDLSVSDDEVKALVREQAAASGEDADELIEHLWSHGSQEQVREDIRLKLALDRVAAEVQRIPMAQAEAREAIWTPEQEKTKDVPKLWTPGG
jgi:trigger factor